MTAALALACVAVDAVATWILLAGSPLQPPLGGFVAAASHGTAVLLLSRLDRGRPSRRWLGVAAMLAVPCVGAAVAAAVLVTKGRGSVVMERRREVPPRPISLRPAIRRLARAPSLCDALYRGGAEDRRAALSTLSRRSDPVAIALLRWAAGSPDPDLALSAALVLDEISERAERRAARRSFPQIRHEAG